jgi:hypothetical protein
MDTITAVIIVVAVIVVALVAWFLFRQRRTQSLRRKFGPEYDHAVREFGGREKAEDALAAREKRMERIHIHSLSPGERDRFAEEWHNVQARFVDDPPRSIQDADRLVNQVMGARGYPMAEFDRRAEDLSVEYPHVIRNYRAAHAIALRREKGEASTEDLRKALVYYRDLFDELLGVHAHVGPREVRR